MRDPDRIEPVLTALRDAWYANSDWRLCQLISNLHGTGPQDIFYTEDDALLTLLRETVREAPE